MLNYLNISYKTQPYNKALKKCIMFIGKYYGKNNGNLYKSGVNYLAKKVRGATRNSVNYMVYPKSIKNSTMKQWKFKKNAYTRTYRYILYKMSKDQINQEEARSLLKQLFLEIRNDPDVSKLLSDVLVLEQKRLLLFAVDKPQYNKKSVINILDCYSECDSKYINLLR